jgi:drug/metabolite transporter (DMT)-like permease
VCQIVEIGVGLDTLWPDGYKPRSVIGARAAPQAAMPALSIRASGLLLAIAAPLLWSVGGVIIRTVDAGPWDIIFWRAAGHLLFFPFVIAAFWGRAAFVEARAAGLPALVISCTMGGTFVFHVLGMTRTAVANVLILQSMSPLLVAVLGRWILGERLSLGRWLVIALAFSGLITVVAGSLGGGRMAGNLFALMVAACSATHVLIMRRNRARNLAAVTLLAAALAATAALPMADPLAVPVRDIGLLLALGGVQMSLGMTCFMIALRRLPATEVTLISLLEPVLGPVWVWLVIAEQPPVTTLIGGAVVLGALATNIVMAARQAPAAAAG